MRLAPNKALLPAASSASAKTEPIYGAPRYGAFTYLQCHAYPVQCLLHSNKDGGISNDLTRFDVESG